MRCRNADVQMCRDVDMEVLRCRDGAGAGKEVQRLYKGGAKEVQRGIAEAVKSRCRDAEMQRQCSAEVHHR